MGRAKAEITIAGEPNAQRLTRLLREVGADPVVYSGNPKAYSFRDADWVTDREANAGPLSALLGFYDQHGPKPAILLATDLYAINREAIQWLLEQGTAQSQWPRFANEPKAHPLASIYAATAWPHLNQAWDEGKRAIMQSLPKSARNEPQIPAQLEQAFRSANTPDELAGMQDGSSDNNEPPGSPEHLRSAR
jgi:molybdopterin-guanine dinucleotide biosynthesis protein A